MWLDARELRKVLDDMLKLGRKGDAAACEALRDAARASRRRGAIFRTAAANLEAAKIAFSRFS
jgi:hypothetical protein